MKKIVLIVAALIVSACCATKPPKPSEQTIVHHKDSIVFHDSTVYHTLYKERYKDYTSLLDTLKMETTYSRFYSYVDTTVNRLNGLAENKDIEIPVKIKWKEKVVYKDSVSIKEIPYPVEVVKTVTKYPKTYWWFMAGTILALGYIGLKIYLKFKLK